MALGPASHRFISQRLQLHYVDWGNPGAPPLLLLHGGQDHCRNWDWVAENLSRDWHVIAPDLRGHGDSAWSPDGDYSMTSFVYDLAQLVHQLQLAPLSVIAHSMGGIIALRYAGLYPGNVDRLAVIEGLGPPPEVLEDWLATPFDQRFREWIDRKRSFAGRQHRRYPCLEDAYARMKEENNHLSDEQARHLTIHGISQNEDGTYSWKFDNYVRTLMPVDLSRDEIHTLWNNIACPTLLLYGADSWASNPERDGSIGHFRDARVIEYENAGHWLHHDQFERFIADIRTFL